MVAVEHVRALLLVPGWSHDDGSPFMSLAVTVRPAWRRRLAAVTHFDNTTRVQTVSASTDAWLHRVLLAAARANGVGVLANTSLNTRGRPIVNLVAEAMALLEAEQELGGLLVEDWLFRGCPQA